MIIPELGRLYNLLASFLGDAKNGYDDSNMQLQFPCPRCVENYGHGEETKYNLEINLQKQLFHCWKCNSSDDYEMKGTIRKLIKLYGNETIMKEYNDILTSIKESKLYKLNNSIDINTDLTIDENVKLPKNYHILKEDSKDGERAVKYLLKRGLNWRIIKDFNIGYTSYSEDEKIASNRIILPSYDKFGDINYWTGRDFTENDKRQKYFNPKVERKDVIFNEEKIQWDADITLVEGPFDHIVVPNSIPLLGKVLNERFKLFWELNKNANANINIFLDGDAFESVMNLYRLLNHGRLYNKIRYIPVESELDPSKIFEIGGNKLIIEHLKKSTKIKEQYL